MTQIQNIPDGYSVCGGRCTDGWYAGVLILPDTAPEIITPPDGEDYYQRADRAQRWADSCAQQQRLIGLVQPGTNGAGDELTTEILVAGNRLDGPVAPKEECTGPALAWTERCDECWELRLYTDGKIRTVFRQPGILRCPAIALVQDTFVLACERDAGDSETEVILLQTDGTMLCQCPGRNPRLAATPDGVLLLTEQYSEDNIHLDLRLLQGSDVLSEVRIQQGAYTFNADLAWAGTGSESFVVAESSPAFGWASDHGLHRTLHVWRVADGTTAPIETAGTTGLPTARHAFMSLGPENIPPITPTLLVEQGAPTVVFRQFRYFETKTFGWDVFWSRWHGQAWTEPVRLSVAPITPDTGYCIVPVTNGYVGMFPALNTSRGPSRPTDLRVEFVAFDTSHELPAFEVPADRVASYRVPQSYTELAPEPPATPVPYPGRTLIWGDLHVHTTYSKCVAAVDGSPAENIRFARDALGCRVFTLTEHFPYMSDSGRTWVNDKLEMIAGDNAVVLYSNEPGQKRGRHTNWYARDRNVFDRLCCAMVSYGYDRQDCYRYAREQFEPNNVIVMRHYHGHITDEAEMVQSFEPRLEMAMESMQGRRNSMVEPDEKIPLFPNQFLDAGFKIGLVGGTDHYRSGSNHFCLTGFWVREISRAGVWEAIRNRYTFAMSDSRLAMTATLNGVPAGNAVALNSRDKVSVRLCSSCARPIKRAALIRDGEILDWQDVGETSATIDLEDRAPLSGRHWYVPTVEVETAFGPDSPGYGHASPFHVILA